MSLTLRSTKGSALTYAEADANFAGLADGSLVSYNLVTASLDGSGNVIDIIVNGRTSPILPNRVAFVPQDLDIHNVYPDEPLLSLLTLPSPYYPALSREHVYLIPVYSPARWYGYNFWAAAAPYPASDQSKENPCIYVSNDGENWIAAPGVTNPIFGPPAVGNYSDPSLTFSPDGLTLYLTYIWENAGGTIPGGFTYGILGSQCTNGVAWSSPVVLYGTSVAGNRPDSQSLFWNPNLSLWGMIHIMGAGASVQKLTNSNTNPLAGTWSANSTVAMIHPLGRPWWHMHCVGLSSGRVIAMMQDNGSGGGCIYTGSSLDGGDNFGVQPFSHFDSATAGGTWYKPGFCVIPDILKPKIILFTSRINSYMAQRASPVLTWLIQKCTLNLDASAIQGRNALFRDMINRIISLGKGAVFWDSFNRANQATTIIVADSGQSWTSDSAPGNPIGINGNTAYNATTGNCKAQFDTGMQDFYVEVTFPVVGTNCFLLFNYQDASNFWRYGNNSGASWVLQKVVAGSVSFTLASGPNATANGDIIGIERKGYWITVYKNDRVLDSLQDSQFAISTKVGLQASGAVATNFDNFMVKRGHI